MPCEWLSPRQAAEKVGVTPSTVYRWIRKGTVVVYLTPGGTIRICEKDLMRKPEPREIPT